MQRDRFALHREGRAKRDVAVFNHQIGGRSRRHHKRLGGVVIFLIVLSNNRMRIHQHLNLAVAALAFGLVCHLGRRATARRNQINGLLGAHGDHAAIGHIHKLDQHILGILAAVVEHRDGDANGLALGGAGRCKGNVAGLSHQVWRRRRRNRHGLVAFIVRFVRFGNKVVGIHNDADLALTAEPTGIERHLGNTVAAGGNPLNELLFTNGHGAPAGHIGKLHQHIFRIGGAVVDDDGADGDLITARGVARRKTDGHRRHRQVGRS